MKIALIDHRRGYADMFQRVLQDAPCVTEVISAADFAMSLAPSSGAPPDVILIQLSSFLAQLSLLEDRRRSLPASRLFVISDSYTDTQLDLLVRMNVTGVLTSDQPLHEIIDTLLRVPVLHQDRYFPASIMERLEYDRKHCVYSVKRRNEFMTLTLRQLDVLIQIARGSTVKEVARRLFLSERAIESHKYRIMRKLGIQDRVELCLFAIREGVIQA